MFVKLASPLAAFILLGCSSVPESRNFGSTAKSFVLVKNEDPRKSTAELSEENREKIEEAFSSVLSFCQTRLSGYEEESKIQAKRAFWLSLSGLVSGAVLAPALTAANASANAVWIAGLSGWAGATNFAGQSYRTSGLSGSTIAQTRNEIIRNVRSQIEIASDGSKSFEERRNALMQARADCILYEVAVPSVPSVD